jgi:hypothetical protein
MAIPVCPAAFSMCVYYSIGRQPIGVTRHFIQMPEHPVVDAIIVLQIWGMAH